MKTSILTIAGSDSCAGAGMQIDLKTAAAHGVYATCAVTALTAQNTSEVRAIQLAEPEVLREQIRAVFDDLPPKAVKVGMLGSAELAEVVAEELGCHRDVPVVLDPVLVATAGGKLTDAAAFEAIRDSLIAQASVITPNLPETEALSGIAIGDIASLGQAAGRLMNAGARAVLVKGGHGTEDEVFDRLYTGAGMRKFRSKRLDGEFHGTGCSLSTAIACNLAQGLELEEAVDRAHAYLADALQHSLDFGSGSTIFDPLNKLTGVYAS